MRSLGPAIVALRVWRAKPVAPALRQAPVTAVDGLDDVAADRRTAPQPISLMVQLFKTFVPAA
jgi:hypothetical protein